MLQIAAASPDAAPPADSVPDPATVCRWIIGHVASHFLVEPGELTAPTRGSPRIAFARQIAMYLAHVGFGLSFEAVGRHFGRDRTTVSHACRVVEDSRDDLWLDCRLAVLERACCVQLEAGDRR